MASYRRLAGRLLPRIRIGVSLFNGESALVFDRVDLVTTSVAVTSREDFY